MSTRKHGINVQYRYDSVRNKLYTYHTFCKQEICVNYSEVPFPVTSPPLPQIERETIESLKYFETYQLFFTYEV